MKKLFILLAGLIVVAFLLIGRRPEHEPSSAAGISTASEDRATSVAAPVESTTPAVEPAPASVVSGEATFGASALETPRRPDFAKVIAFNDWAQRWVTADSDTREIMRAEGLQLAQQRRPEFKALIVIDPQRALEEAVPRVVRQQLPAEIVATLERPVSTVGNYKVYLGRPAPGMPLPETGLTLRYFETADGDSYKARVHGAMEPAMSKQDVPLRGVAVDREFAVAESPVRQLEIGERIEPGISVEETCPVSGETTIAAAPSEPVSEQTPTVEVGGKIIRLCNGTHVQVLDEKYRMAMGQVQASGPGGAGYFYDSYPGTASEAIGNFRCLYIRITYPDQMRAPNTEDSAYGDMRNVSRYYLESSFGKLTTTSVVTPLVVLPHSQAWYIAKDSEVDGLGLVHSDARSAARKLGYDSTQFNCTIVRVNGGPRLSGISWGGGDSVWVSWDGMDVLNHECGHSLGRNHANYWQTTDGTPYGVGANQEYGNSFDVMGGGSGFGAHYNSISKRALGWLPDAYVHKPTANGIFRIYAYDQPQLEDGKRYAFRVAKDSLRTYYVEYHPAMGGQLPNSAVLLYSISGMSNAGHLLDTTQGSSGGKGDGGIQIGRTYSDPEADLHLTVVGKNASTPPSLDVAYYRGPFPGNQPPTLSLNASATTIANGGSITFTTTASDPDGDALAYQWDFSDGVASTNTPNFTRTFPSADQMTVMVTASDMKGGIARRHVVVNVGNHGRQAVTGQVIWNGEPLMGVRITSDSGKFCFTDTDGNYALTDLQTGARTLTATLNGFTFAPQFSNPLNVVAGTNTANWTATSQTLVALTKTADTAEGGTNGAFTLTRTGSTGSALTVRIAPVAGTATRTTDYAFNPDYANDGDFRTFTIPAGQASLTINVQPVNDSSQEGPETILMQLASGSGYLTYGPGSAVMTLDDNDTTLPKVSVIAQDQYATEAPGDAASFTFSRTGPTTNALVLTVAYSGSATNGSDYTALPAPVTIPAGQPSVTVQVSPLNDSALESPEDCTVTISSGAAYLRDSSAQTATVTISDDDQPVLTVTALDATMAEEGRDAGVVLITRTGSTANPLRVFYGLSGSALHGTDYMALPGEITIPAGAASVPVIITPYDDDLGEPDTQSVTFNLTTFDNTYSLGASFSANLTITDNDDVPMVSVRNSATGSEPSTNGTVIFRATGSASGNITVHYTLGGTATAGSDFTAPSGTVSISANGSNEVTVNIPVLNDAVAEDTETVIVTLTPDPAYRVYGDASAVVRIRDDEKADRVMVSTWNSTPTEGGGNGQFYLSRGGSSGNLSVNYIMSGTATNGSDYTVLTGTVVIPDGETGVDLTVTPTNDALVEGTETVTLTVIAGTGYGADVPASATLYLADNETLPISVGFASDTGTTTEAPGALGEFRDIAVTLSAASPDAVTVEYLGGGGTASGDDIDWSYVDAAAGNSLIPNGVLTFPPGTTTQNVRIRVKTDGIVEGSETAILELRNPRFARLSTSRNKHTLTITDANDPLRRVRFLLSASARSESEGGEPMLMAVLDRAASSTPVSVNYTVGGTATAGSDYTLAPGTITFAAGESVKLLPLTIHADGTQEAPETIVVTLSGPTNAELVAPTTHTITLLESNIPAVTIAAAATEIAESGGTAQFTVTRSGSGISVPLTVFYTTGGTASGGSDYTAPTGSVIIPASAASAPLAIQLQDDPAEEPDETLIVTLSADVTYNLGTTNEATTTILDDDSPPAVSIISPVRSEIAILPGVGLMLRAEASRVTPQGAVSVPVTWSMLSGPGTINFEPQDATFTAATFSASGAYVLRASATHGTATGTADLKVTIGNPLAAQNIGTTTAFGSWSEADSTPGSSAGGTITLHGAGSGLSSSGTSDGFYFLAAPMTGDFDVKCRITDLTNPAGSNSCRFGIMVRASLAANAPYAMSLHRGSGTHGFHARLTAGANPYDTDGTTEYVLPRWVRLVRSGDDFSAYYSADGETWGQRGTTQTIPAMGASPLLGLAITSADVGTLSTAVFDNLGFHLPTNLGPFVNAGVMLTGSGPWNLDATVTDDGRPTPPALTPLWRMITGPGAANFTSPSSVDTGVTFSAAGSYRLRLTVSDGAITTFDETTANVTTASPLEAWRLTHFGTTANTGNAADTADPDLDGLVNLIEYALGTVPTESGLVPVNVTHAGSQLILSFARNPARTDVTLLVEASVDLAPGSWTAVARSENGGAFGSLVPEVSVEENGSGPIAVTVTIEIAPPQPAHRYFRIKVETP